MAVGAASTAGTLAWWKHSRPLSKEVWSSLTASIAAAVPGLALAIDMGVRWFLYEIVGVDVAPIYESPTMMLSVLWVLVAPWLLVMSWALRPKAASPKATLVGPSKPRGCVDSHGLSHSARGHFCLTGKALRVV